MKKSINTGMLAALLLFSALGLSACGNAENAGNETETPATVAATEENNAATEEAAAPAAGDEKTVEAPSVSPENSGPGTSGTDQPGKAEELMDLAEGPDKIACPVDDLGWKLTPGKAEGDTLNFVLEATNRGKQTCYLVGSPDLTYLSSANEALTAHPEIMQNGPMPIVKVPPTGVAKVELQVTDPKKIADCQVVNANQIRIELLGQPGVAEISGEVPVCANVSNSKIGSLRAK
ncbi:hypothetical protein BK816_07790 [Boudabousia tangfeifanii]|uniref:DUF4232 domain-containing protein n=1 Tax=Boudabousia tangfeifanii TaxID=1912795 RepID=A0A1D9MLN5_9ACTO|nr:DUF4232 domain-containing protein [Boudabousia tangfeifanii]AOZ73206.1 hypothetical protein BK816_07790 [Boudabousia tangfeifanii]